jgi:uncharacterized protein (DUF1697 family)
MPAYIALLRGINVGGRRLVKMTDLQSYFAFAGAENVSTYIQSGNVIFQHRAKTPVSLQTTLARHLAARLGYVVSVIVKSAADFAAIASANPFEAGSPEFGKRMYVCFFEKAPAPAAIESIQPHITDTERLVVKGAVAYAYFANGLGRAKLTSAIIERKLGLATLRNWNTVTALVAWPAIRDPGRFCSSAKGNTSWNPAVVNSAGGGNV